MQRETSDRIFRAAVELIAEDRMSRLGEMRADLVLASGLELDLEHRIARVRFDRAVVRDRVLRFGMRSHALHLQIASLDQV